EPAHAQEPGTHGEPGYGRRRDSERAASLIVAAEPCSEAPHSRKAGPATKCVHDDRAGEIMELGAEQVIEKPFLQAEVLVPGDAPEQRIAEADDQRCRRSLRGKSGTLGNAPRDNSGHRGSKHDEKKEPDEAEALRLRDGARASKKADAIRDGVTDQKIGNR